MGLGDLIKAYWRDLAELTWNWLKKINNYDWKFEKRHLSLVTERTNISITSPLNRQICPMAGVQYSIFPYLLSWLRSNCSLLIEDVVHLILGDPGVVSRVGRKGGTKVFKLGRKSPWVPTLIELFPKIQADAGSWLGTKKCFVLLCPIGEQFLLSSFRGFVHEGYCLATLAWFVHQACACKGNFYFILS